MCTALALDHFFGRTLDLEHSYDEQVVVVPRRFPLLFRAAQPQHAHYSFTGMAHLANGFPLFYDAVNEAGLAIAALNFPLSAVYGEPDPATVCLAPFELIPWVLGRCACVTQARRLLEQVQIITQDFSPQLPSTPLHWLMADRDCALTIESTADGLHLYDNPTGVLTNEPPFPLQMSRLHDFIGLSATPPANRFSPFLPLTPYSRGMGALGLPGDWSSPSRFVRCTFAAHNSPRPTDITQFFHLMSAVEVPRGCVRLESGQQVRSIYTSCCDLSCGIYSYVTYENRQIRAVDPRRCDRDGADLHLFPLPTTQHILTQP